ncbi:hypothetical protein HMPREF0281_02233 [Corynebacterium ammoniagenes DSM 20306]|uniref:Uncharacterized protein n=1 Tax=Corynebacterium ammoniagenes DSM 20306 TaxID=649754 RepID=A0ABP2II03_CORAM|nr:hypothetical protein HMPREF0281_02233 [Corynebacterium ammoniagenes DSM 20306]
MENDREIRHISHCLADDSVQLPSLHGSHVPHGYTLGEHISNDRNVTKVNVH